MKKGDFIEKYGKEAYAHQLVQNRASAKVWRGRNPDKVIERARAYAKELSRKGGKFYERHQVYKQTGISGEKERVRKIHGNCWRLYKRIIAPDSQLHHEWIEGTAGYTGMALVEADAHMHGIIDVIEILKGKITLLTEEEVRKGCKNETE